jgi:hypothetical protein
MQLTRTGKSHYSETEAAEELGISIEQLRVMIRSHVIDRDEDLTNVPSTTFQPSDLLILRLLAGKGPIPPGMEH